MPQFATATIVGHLGRDPEIRYTADGSPVASCAVAVTRKRRDSETTTWWKVTLFGKRAEILPQYLHKGDPVLFTGEPYLDKWTAHDGTERQTLCLDARDFAFIGGGSGQGQPQQPRQQPPAQPQQPPSAAPFEDDIPF